MIRNASLSIHHTPLRVGIVGLGRSGWNIHAQTLRKLTDQYQLAAVSDPVTQRCEEAVQTFGCRAYGSFEAMIEDRSLELIVVASPNHLHTDHAIAAMKAGKHVVAEKPFALSAEDADRMIEAARQTGMVLAPFQNRRYEPHFLKVKQIIDSGSLGRIVQVRMAWHQFGRRWDWQTLRRFGGGLLSNNGSHLLDHALQLIDENAEVNVFADLQRVISLGDTDDHVKIVLKAGGGPTIDVELTNACAYPQDRWFIMGSAGGLRGTIDHLEWRTVDWATMPDRELILDAAPDRLYNRETIHWQEHRWEKPADAPHEYTRFYLDLLATIHDDQPLFITPQSLRRLIALQERCYELCPQLVS